MNNERFVKQYLWAFNNGKTSLDVSKKIKLDVRKVYVRANYLRKSGVKLPFLNKESGRRDLNIQQLNEIIAKNHEAHNDTSGS